MICLMMKKQSPLRRFWHFVWEEDSLASWTVAIILAFILIKFILYPGLGLIFGTSHPIVAVVSGSMEHDGNFDKWWNSMCVNGASSQVVQSEIYKSHEITKSEFQQFPFKNGFNTGDLMILWRPKNIEVGDIIVFNSNSKYDPIIHRVVEVKSGLYLTKGDHNCGSSVYEDNISQEQVIGKGVLRIPFLGYVKLIFMKIVSFIVNLIR